ncbi:MAG: hypothetical protein OEX02_21370 [Cyclobacteriaceae bacterium]|nr:hypothetical protein [Cyclobacteriaceae bacterium]
MKPLAYLLFIVGLVWYRPGLCQSGISLGINAYSIVKNPILARDADSFKERYLKRSPYGLFIYFNKGKWQKRGALTYLNYDNSYVYSEIPGIYVSHGDQRNEGQYRKAAVSYGMARIFTANDLSLLLFTDIVSGISSYKGEYINWGWSGWSPVYKYDIKIFNFSINPGIGIIQRIGKRLSIHLEGDVFFIKRLALKGELVHTRTIDISLNPISKFGLSYTFYR